MIRSLGTRAPLLAHRLSPLIFLLSLGTASISHAGTTPEAWTLLWQNESDPAISSFETVLEESSDDLSARRGLALAHFSRGHERRAIEAVFELAKKKDLGFEDYLTARWIYDHTVTHGLDEKMFQKAFEKLSKSKKMDLLERRRILDEVGRFAISNGDGGRARKIGQELNRVLDWSVLGPFDNTSGSGHPKSHLDPAAFSLQTAYTGKAGQRFRWQNPSAFGLRGHLDFSDCFERSNSITAYAGTAFEIEEDGRYLLSVSKTGAIVLRLGGTKVLDVEEETHQNELHHLEVELTAGRHALLAKVSAQSTPPTIAASLSTLEGKRPKNLAFAPLVPGRLPDTPVVFEERALPFARDLDSWTDTPAADPTEAFLRLAFVSIFGLMDAGRDVAELTIEHFEDSALLRYAAGAILNQAGDEDGWRAQMKAIRELDPLNGPAAVREAEDLMRRKLFTRADSLLDELAQRAPDYLNAEVTLLRLHQERGDVEQIVEKSESLARRFPELSTPYQVLADHYETLDRGKASRYRAKALDRMPHGVEVFSLLQSAIDEDDVSVLVRQFETLAKLYPSSPEIHVQLATAKLRLGDARAIDLTDEVAEQFPYSYAAQRLEAAMSELLIPHSSERKATAIEHYEKALNLRPGDFETRDNLRRLKDLKPISEILPPITLDEARAREVPEDSGADACVLTDQRRRILFEDGSTHSERALVVKILTEEGAERFGSIHTGVNPLFSDLTILSARTLKESGEELEAQTLLGSVAFQAIKPGDVVELHYQTSSWSLGKLNQEYWDSHLFRWTIPCLESRYVLLVPEGTPFHWKLHNYDDPSAIMKEEAFGEFALYSWELTNLEARDRDYRAPSHRDVSPWLDVSTIDDWGTIVEWYGELSDEHSKTDPRIAAKVEELLGAESDRNRKIAVLYDFVANQVAYEDLSFQYSAYIPEPAADVMRSGYGDCKDQVCLLRAMLQAVDVESYFTLVSPFHEGLESYLPSPRFSHAILAVPEGDDYWFLDPTATGMPATSTPENLQGVMSLVVRPGSDRLTRIPYREPSAPGLTVATEATFDAAGDLVVTREEIVRDGSRIASIRSRYRGKTGEQQLDLLTERRGRRQVGLEFLSASWEGLDPGSDSVVVHSEAKLRDPVTETGNLRLAKLPWRSELTTGFAQVVAATSRHEPLLLHGLHLDEEETARLELPIDWRLQELPDPLELTSEYGSFSIGYELVEGAIRARRSLRIDGGPVPPEEYPAFKEFLEGVIRAQDLVLVFSTSG